jgi:hypothetical protein
VNPAPSESHPEDFPARRLGASRCVPLRRMLKSHPIDQCLYLPMGEIRGAGQLQRVINPRRRK